MTSRANGIRYVICIVGNRTIDVGDVAGLVKSVTIGIRDLVSSVFLVHSASEIASNLTIGARERQKYCK